MLKALITLRGIFRRWFPALVALVLCAAYYQYTTHQQAERAALAAAVEAGRLNADGAQVAAAANAAVPPFGLVTGKLVFALAIFFTGLAVVWLMLRFVAPVLPDWARVGYRPAFGALDGDVQVRTFNTVWLSLLGYFAVCVLAACLVS
ncbi:hypothetical protein [Hymenobacter pini]|uniref:hypothetical protein n=1 Tax=Hymenobacter pini TaxID=2880879 RepID=UPI001CF4D962|nr:hypothetical protein [Hymenobacter pini]MCA8830276.1 hypothetical protein [Hymenobacter pini]